MSNEINHGKFKLGDVLKLKEGTTNNQIEEGDPVLNSRGKVRKIFGSTIHLELDAISLQELPEELIQTYMDKGWGVYVQAILEEFLEYAHPRTPDEAAIRFQDDLIERVDTHNGVSKHRIEYNKWVRHFELSERFEALTSAEKTFTGPALANFYDYMKKHERKVPTNWTPNSVKNVLTKWAPRKLVGNEQTFESFHNIILAFFEFLNEKGYRDTGKWLSTVADSRETMIAASQKKDRWTSAKRERMEAMEAGVDMDDEMEIWSFSMGKTLRGFDELTNKLRDYREGIEPEKTPVKVDKRQFKNIWENQKITVQYPDGTIKENIKFKEVKNDLYEGLCELIKK